MTGAAGAAVPMTAAKLHACHDCGQIQMVPALAPGSRAGCLRCDATLRHARTDPLLLPFALHLSALVLFCLAGTLTVISVAMNGQDRAAGLLSGPVQLNDDGLWELSAVVLATTVGAPLLRVLCMLTVLAGIWAWRSVPAGPPGWLRQVFVQVERLRPWSMIEIYMLGLFVAYVRLSGMARVDLGPAVYALGGLMAVMALADATLDEEAVWSALWRPGGGPAAASDALPAGDLIGCDRCGLVGRGGEGTECARCGFRLRARKPGSLARTAALSLAAAVLYVPANLYPVLTVIQLGAGQPSTILGGVQELVEFGMWPLAALVFFASVTVPVLKLLGLGVLLAAAGARSEWRLQDRTVLYRIVDAIGRWSMIDIFMESILVALVQFGALATVYPGPGAIAFAAVVILTMLASRSFDPRIMWDYAGVNGAGAHGAGTIGAAPGAAALGRGAA